MSYTRSKNGHKKRRSSTLKSRSGVSRNYSASAGGNIPDGLMTRSSGNVFEDIGFAPDEAKRLLLRSQLIVAVRDLIDHRKLTQARAAKLFGVTQPRISDLMRGKISLFSVDALITMLA